MLSRQVPNFGNMLTFCQNPNKKVVDISGKFKNEELKKICLYSMLG